MKYLLSTLLLALFISCNSNQSEKPQTSSISSSIPINAADTIYQDDSKLIIRVEKTSDTLLKFKSHIDDKDYSVIAQDIKPKRHLDFSNYEYHKLFFTAIKNGIIEQGVNFAGHFCFVYWGCGSPCKLSAVVDLNTGKVYKGLP